jgi:hypothetical protein
MDWISTNLSFKVGENNPVWQWFFDQSLTGRIVGRIEIRDPNVNTLEAMHYISEKRVEINNNRPHKPDISLPQLIWTKNAGENIWKSSLVYMYQLKSMNTGSSYGYLHVLIPHAPDDEEIKKELIQNPHRLYQLSQQSLDGAFRESGMERLVREMFAPRYSGIVSFHPAYIELIEWLDGSYTNACYPIHK